MIRELKITITTATDTRADSIQLMIEELWDIREHLQTMEDSETYKDITGNIEEYGYEMHSEYKIITE